MKLKAQNNAATAKPAHSVIQWPTFAPPPVHPVFGMTQEHLDYMEKWYSSVQGAVTNRMDAQSKEIESLKSQLKVATTKT